ncbi:MAG: hypothetical protein R8G66_14970 [Cytophagales bacterium]|nr:hypothetical protein [Cytophagales bacterium]
MLTNSYLSKMKKMGIIGAGWLGIRLARLFNENFEIYATTRSADKFESLIQEKIHPTMMEFSGEQVQPIQPWSELKQLDLLILTVNFSKRTEISVLKNRFENVSRFIKGFEGPIFLMSSIGVYPSMEMEIEEDTITESELQPNIRSVELQMQTAFPQINILRLAGLMGDDRFLSKYKIKDTHQAANHIHYEDIAGVIEKMISVKSSAKTYNVVAPKHPTKQDIMDQQLGEATTIEAEKPAGRIILTKKVINELGYVYKRPDPRFFKEAAR